MADQIEIKLAQVRRHQTSLERCLAELDEGTDPYRQMLIEYGIRYQQMRREWLESLLARAEGRSEPVGAAR